MAEVDVLTEDPAWDVLDLSALCDRAVTATLDRMGMTEGEIAILACDDARIAALNADFRGKPRPTNVLSWPSEERGAREDGGTPALPSDPELGDIAIAFETTSAEARSAGLSLADHTTHLIVHATLHLLGYDHERDCDAALMEGLEVEILGKLGLADPYSR